MIGLIRKDLYMIWRYGRMLMLMCAVFLVFSAVQDGDNFFFAVYPVVFAGVLPVTLISYEERDGWNRYCDTMPISRRTVVNERYVMCVLFFLALYLLTLAVHAAVKLPKGEGADVLALAAMLPAFGLAAPAFMLPITLRFGVEKGRIAYYVLIGVTVALGLILFDSITDMNSTVGETALWIMLAATLVVFAVSWLLSIRLYETREL